MLSRYISESRTSPLCNTARRHPEASGPGGYLEIQAPVANPDNRGTRGYPQAGEIRKPGCWAGGRLQRLRCAQVNYGQVVDGFAAWPRCHLAQQDANTFLKKHMHTARICDVYQGFMALYVY